MKRPGPSPRSRRSEAACAVLVAAATAVTLSCGEEVVVRVSTRVYAEGGVGRRVEIVGTESDGSKPKGAGWLADKARILLARREAWSRIEESPGRVVAEGFFLSPRDLPPALAHRTDRGEAVDRSEATWTTDDLLILEHRVWRDSVGDPFGAPQVEAALDSILAVVGEALRSEVGRTVGPELDPSGIDRFLRTRVRPFARDLRPAIRAWRSADDAASTAPGESWAEIFRRHGVRVDDAGADLSASANLEALSAWLREGVAASLATPDRPVGPADLSFWPDGDGAEEQLTAIAHRTFGGVEEPAERLRAAFEAMGGVYGEAGGPRLRFETRLSLPGRILRTNGTIEGEEIVWFHRDRDLRAGERVFVAETVEPRDESLRALGARRGLDAIRLLRLCDLLAEREPGRSLRPLLAAAIRRGSLAGLRDAEAVPEPLRPAARELADLLDPEVEELPLP